MAALVFDTGNQRENLVVGGICYFGEFPLSFAASVGDVHVCHLLAQKAKDLILLALQNLHDEDSVEQENALQKEYATEFFSSLCSVDGALDEAAMEKISQSSSTQTSLSALLSGI